MAQRVVRISVDDVDGGSGDETIVFGLDGILYEIDLSTAHAKQLREDLRRWVQVARIAGTAPRTAAHQVEVAADPRAVRAWAAARGLTFPAKGRMPQDIVDQFHAAGN